MISKQFGARISEEQLNRYEKSPNWNEGKFQNLEPTELSIGLSKVPGIIYQQFKGRAERQPNAPLPIETFDSEAFLAPSEQMKFIWYGHSVVLMRMNEKTILIDPMLGPDASPIAPFGTKRYSENTLALIEQFPEIDLLLMTHDHYDHLDYDSITKLIPKVKKYYVALGVKRHLVKWGVSANLITEFDWWDHKSFDDIKITFTPSRHFSGRGLTDRAKSLWGGWVFKSPSENIWFSGDGGFGKHFVEIGDRLGPFDFAFMECGQYNEAWHQIHMYPEECVQAAMDGKAKKCMPVHWGAFSLAPHHWKDPVDRFVDEAQKRSCACLMPRLGQMVTVDSEQVHHWWQDY